MKFNEGAEDRFMEENKSIDYEEREKIWKKLPILIAKVLTNSIYIKMESLNERLNFYYEKEINKLLKDKKFKKLVNVLKRHAKNINKQQEDFYKLIEKIQKDRKKFEKQLAQFTKIPTKME